MFIRRGKYIKAGSRSIESWIKQLPDPANDEQILYFQNELHHSYKITLKQYLDIYDESVDCKNATLFQCGEEILATQRLWVQELNRKLNNFASNLTFESMHYLEPP